jgi:hypothetical protein
MGQASQEALDDEELDLPVIAELGQAIGPHSRESATVRNCWVRLRR